MFYYRKLILKEGFKIENKICTCFGHRETYRPFSRNLSEVLEDLISKGLILKEEEPVETPENGDEPTEVPAE